MFSTIGIDIFLGQTEIDYVDDLVLFRPGPADQEVFRFYIPEDEPLAVNVLYPSYELLRYHQHGLQAKTAATKAEQVLETGS